MFIVDKSISIDNNSVKFLQETEDKIVTETAYIDNFKHSIICFSSQLGCPIGCKICYNGVYKNFYRNLTKEEIVRECTNVVKLLELDKKDKPILFSCMGVGEPLLNYQNVIDAIKELDNIYPNSKFALATTGINPEFISKIATDLKDLPYFKLTISLHACRDDLRNQIIPNSTKISILKREIENYKLLTNQFFEWNYCLIDGLNDSIKDAIELVNFIEKDDNIKISSFNEIDGCSLKKSSNSIEFLKVLDYYNVKYKVFNSFGKDIEVGCGQMATHYNQKIKRFKEE